jgi:hypothetical protein
MSHALAISAQEIIFLAAVTVALVAFFATIIHDDMRRVRASREG